MDNEQKWSEISGDIANVAKKIKSRIDEEDLVEDLKDTFKNTIESTSELITNILQTVESTVTDEEIKKETKEIVSNVNAELANLLNQTRNKFSESHIQNLMLRKSRYYLSYNKRNVYNVFVITNWVGSSIGRAGAFSSRSWVDSTRPTIYFEILNSNKIL